jgi:hypothetical protein
MSDYNLLLQPMSEFCLSSTCFTVFILGPVTSCFLRFFAVPVCGSWILKLSGTGLVRGPPKKSNRTETGPDFKALVTTWSAYILTLVLQGPVRRTGMGPRTGPDCNWFERTNGPGPYNLFEKDRKRPRS